MSMTVPDSTMTDLSKCWQRLSREVSGHKDRLTCDEMIDLCELAGASAFGMIRFATFNFIIVITCDSGLKGGLLFEYFVFLAANYESRRLWRSVRKDCCINARQVSADENRRLVKMAKVSFYFHVLSTLGSRGTSANRQLFYLTLLFRHKGLSRSGIEVMNRMNIALPLRSFDKEVSDHLYRYEETVR